MKSWDILEESHLRALEEGNYVFATKIKEVMTMRSLFQENAMVRTWNWMKKRLNMSGDSAFLLKKAARAAQKEGNDYLAQQIMELLGKGQQPETLLQGK